MLKTFVTGRLGKDCVVNTVNGKNVINFSIAHSERWKDKDGNKQERTTWVDCAYWVDRPAISTYLIKGTLVAVEGQPEAKAFQRNDGTPAATLNIRVNQIELLSKGTSASHEERESEMAGEDNTSVFKDPKDDLPF